MVKKFEDGHLDEPALKYARTDVVRLRADQTVRQALEAIQKSEIEGRIIYFYVVTADDRLCGVLPTRRLLLSSPETIIRDIMLEKVVALPESATLLDACEFFILHKLLAFPIVDQHRKLLGVIDVELYTEEISDLARRDESEDIFQLIGVRLAEVQQATLPVVFARRFPWLLCNVAGGLACAVLAGWYQGILDKVILLALFIPVVLALAESVSIQSLTLTLQAQHGRPLSARQGTRSFFRELISGTTLGLGCGVLVAAAAWIWSQEVRVALSIFLSLVLALTAAAVIGRAVPTILRAAQRDPKIASGPITLTLTDIVTLLFYFSLATTWLGN